MTGLENSLMQEEENYYQILSVPSTATLIEIRNAFEEKLEEAYKILDQAAAILLKEVYVNMEMGLKNWTPDCANHENRLWI